MQGKLKFTQSAGDTEYSHYPEFTMKQRRQWVCADDFTLDYQKQNERGIRFSE